MLCIESQVLLEKGHNMEVFIEGTRSRMGKLLQPKLGILKIIMDAVESGRLKDVIIVPMSIGIRSFDFCDLILFRL